MYDFYQISLKLILRNPEGKILGLKAVDTGMFAGFFDLPGGRINVDEFNLPFHEIIKREVTEEVGKIKFTLSERPIAASRKVILAEFTTSKEKDVHVLYLFFEADYLDGSIEISQEHQGFEWLNLSNIELEKYFAPGLIDGIKMYLGK